MDEPLHPDLELARYGGARGKQDKFLGFWLHLVVDSRQHSDPRSLAKIVKRFFEGREVAAAVASAGAPAVQAELTDAARLFFESSLNDSQYSSSLFGLKRLTPDAVRAKAAGDAARLVALLARSGTLDGPAEPLPRLFVDGYLAAMAPHGAHELREAVEHHPAAAAIIRSLFED